MKRVFVFLVLVVLGLALALGLLAKRLDYGKIVIVLPSSYRVASPYFYKKDGDFFLANDLKLGLEKLGYEVEYRYREDYKDINFGNAGNVIYFKGYYNFKNLPKDDNDKRKYVLYLYYVEGLNVNILDEADAVACGSRKLIEDIIKPRGAKAYYVPQFTNPERFVANYDEKFYNKVLFVGSNHTGNGREVVDFTIKSGENLSVYGKFWDKILDVSQLKGKFIENDELYKYYANADVVLNDHREDMKYFGCVSNRIYDVTASGGFVISDYLPEIEEVYGDSVVMYKSFDDFNQKLKYYLNNPYEREKLAKKAQKITLENFTNLAIAKKFDDILKNILK